MNKLIYVSNNVFLKDGKENPLFLQEKEILLKKFGGFYIVTHKGIFFCNIDQFINKIYTTTFFDRFRAKIYGGLNLECFREIKHMIDDKCLSAKNVLKLFRFSMQGLLYEKLLQDCLLRFVDGKNCTIYSFWLSYDAYAVARVKKKYPEIFAVMRAHSYEIQLYRNSCNPYLMKKFICNWTDKIAFISEDSLKEFKTYYKNDNDKLKVVYFGTSQIGSQYIVRPKLDILTILSCSNLVPVKQIKWIIEAIKDWKLCELRWIHIGDGIEYPEIVKLANEKLNNNINIKYRFLGRLTNDMVRLYMKEPNINVFINCSRSEGIPVSIMEAMSVGMPVIAPKINGIPELISDDCGILFELKDGISGLRSALEKFYFLSSDETIRLGENAYEKWKQNFNLENNIQQLF